VQVLIVEAERKGQPYSWEPCAGHFPIQTCELMGEVCTLA
jgi:hypothetical protein